MSSVNPSAPRALAPSTQPAAVQSPKPQQPAASQRPSVPGSRDEFVSSPASLKQHTLLRQGGAGSSTEIKDLQGKLGISQSGKFDAATSAAVKQYQTSKGLKVDGKVGQQTWGSLMGINGLKPGKDMLGQVSGGGGAPSGAGSGTGSTPTKPAPAGGSNPTGPVTQNPPAPSANGKNLTATVDKITNKGARNQMTTGKITVNGHTYTYNSGGHGRGNLPNGDYKVTPHMWSRNTPGMVRDGVGFSFALSDKFDPRVGGAPRSELRIHPDGGSAGTNGCIGIVGNAATLKQFREDMRAEFNRNGGKFNLHVG
ncbi:MAG TPA: peptidoglycan-binding domain-containing protein [Myxococcaceae bacterium]|jgi:hypothetical protein